MSGQVIKMASGLLPQQEHIVFVMSQNPSVCTLGLGGRVLSDFICLL